MAPLLGLVALAASYAVIVIAAPQSSDLSTQSSSPTTIVNQTTCDGNTFTYQQLAGYGFVASNATDKFGDTLGGYGSAIALDKSAWKQTGTGKYSGILYAIPDRGWYDTPNVQGQANTEMLRRTSGTQKAPSITRIASTNSPSPSPFNHKLPSPIPPVQICSSPTWTPLSSLALMERL